MMESAPKEIQRHNVTDLVLRRLAKYSQLNPHIKPGKNVSLVRERVFANLLSKIVNNSDAVEFKEGKGENVDLFQLLDKKKQRLPILIKIVKPDRQEDAERVEKTHKLYVNLLGPEFVEDMTRIPITNKQIIATYKNGRYRDQKRLEGFIQDLRGIDSKQSLYKYLLEHDYRTIPESQRSKIKLFFKRVIDAFSTGYSVDLGVFPESPEDLIETDFRANLLIDSEGVSLIDSGLIYETQSKDGMWKLYLIDLKIACQLFAGKIKSEQAYKIENNKFVDMSQITVQNLELELNQLRKLLRAIK